MASVEPGDYERSLGAVRGEVRYFDADGDPTDAEPEAGSFSMSFYDPDGHVVFSADGVIP